MVVAGAPPAVPKVRPPEMSKAGRCMQDARFRQQFQKTVLCNFFIDGKCSKGDTCKFAHGMGEVQPMPNLKKTSLCVPYLNHRCARSKSECPYAHGHADLRMTEPFKRERKKGSGIAQVGGLTSSAWCHLELRRLEAELRCEGLGCTTSPPPRDAAVAAGPAEPGAPGCGPALHTVQGDAGARGLLPPAAVPAPTVLDVAHLKLPVPPLGLDLAHCSLHSPMWTFEALKCSHGVAMQGSNVTEAPSVRLEAYSF